MNTQIFQIEHKLIRFSTSGSLTSLVNLHNAAEELNLGLLTSIFSIGNAFSLSIMRVTIAAKSFSENVAKSVW